MNHRLFRAAASVAALFVSASCATPAAPLRVAPAPDAYDPAHPVGYLSRDSVPRGAIFLPPPPAPGSAALAADQAAFDSTRALQGSPRWAMAVGDVPIGAEVARRFSCAVGADLTPERAPAIYRLLARVRRDQSATTNAVKDVFARRRPYLSSPAAPICVERTQSLADDYSYPSGHSTFGFSVGMILAELAPDRASEAVARGRAYGDSRVVCGVHWNSDVVAGRVTAGALISRLHAEPAFRADMEAARVELAALRADPSARPEPGACQAEAALMSVPAL